MAGFTPALASLDQFSEKQNILVLCYHDIVADGVNDANASSDVTVSAFKDQMEWLRNEGYQTISADDFYASKKGMPVTLPAKPLLITFDDGYLGEYTYGYTVLKWMGFHGTFFVHTDFVGTVTSKVHMSWDQLREVDQQGLFKIYAHTVTHPNLPDVKKDQLISELRDSRLAVEKHLGGSRPYMAYPYGNFDDAVLKVARQYYSMAFTLDNAVDKPKILHQEDRMAVSKAILTLDDFKESVARWMSVGRP